MHFIIIHFQLCCVTSFSSINDIDKIVGKTGETLFENCDGLAFYPIQLLSYRNNNRIGQVYSTETRLSN